MFSEYTLDSLEFGSLNLDKSTADKLDDNDETEITVR